MSAGHKPRTFEDTQGGVFTPLLLSNCGSRWERKVCVSDTVVECCTKCTRNRGRSCVGFGQPESFELRQRRGSRLGVQQGLRVGFGKGKNV